MTGNDDFSTPAHSAVNSDGQIALFVTLDGFEGPIDLLLSLARDQKVDLTKLAILPLAEQYLAFINTARDLDIEIAADYLVMAAWLAFLKSRLLLPDPDEDEQEETIDMADALKFQLLRLEAMQKAGPKPMALPRLGHERHANGQPEHFAPTHNVTFNATLYDLISAYGLIASAKQTGTLTIASSRLFSVEEAVKRLGELLKVSPGWATLQSYLPTNLNGPLDERSALASHFTAALELGRDGALKLRQDAAFGPIWLSTTKKRQVP